MVAFGVWQFVLVVSGFVMEGTKTNRYHPLLTLSLLFVIVGVACRCFQATERTQSNAHNASFACCWERNGMWCCRQTKRFHVEFHHPISRVQQQQYIIEAQRMKRQGWSLKQILPPALLSFGGLQPCCNMWKSRNKSAYLFERELLQKPTTQRPMHHLLVFVIFCDLSVVLCTWNKQMGQYTIESHGFVVVDGFHWLVFLRHSEFEPARDSLWASPVKARREPSHISTNSGGRWTTTVVTPVWPQHWLGWPQWSSGDVLRHQIYPTAFPFRLPYCIILRRRVPLVVCLQMAILSGNLSVESATYLQYLIRYSQARWLECHVPCYLER